jgi:hypothetical protein
MSPWQSPRRANRAALQVVFPGSTYAFIAAQYDKNIENHHQL